MKVSAPKPFFFEGGSRAVLLLHGFTGNSSDVRMLGRFLQKNGYSSLAPHYRGHGESPEALIRTAPDEWWEDAHHAYAALRDKGYREIAVAGLSLGGVFALRIAMEEPVKGVVTMCSPMTMKTVERLFQGVLKFARNYKAMEGKSEEEIESELAALARAGMPSLGGIRTVVADARSRLPEVTAPLLAIQGRQDRVVNLHSPAIITEESSSVASRVKWFEQSGHVITLGPEKEAVYREVLSFFNGLDWTV